LLRLYGLIRNLINIKHFNIGNMTGLENKLKIKLDLCMEKVVALDRK